MKKLLFSLLLLLCVTAAWAGSGAGTKENPYSGEWQAADLRSELKAGDYLAYDFKYLNGIITVNDSKLNKCIVSVWANWAMADAIDDTPFEPYISYCAYNTPEERKQQMFILTDVTLKTIDNKESLFLTGYYSGVYPFPGADGFIPVATAEQLRLIIQNDNSAKVKITSDIDISNLGKICDTFRGTIDGKYETTDEEGNQMTAVHILSGKGDGDHWLFETVDHAYIANVAFYNFKVSLDEESSVGVIARDAFNTTFDGVQIFGASVFCNHDWAGTLAGTASLCVFKGVKVLGSDVTVYGIGAGSLVGASNYSQYSDCIINATTRVFADGRLVPDNVAYGGGLVGSSTTDDFVDCVFSGWVGADCDEVGGIAGHSLSSNFLRCVNYGTVIQCKEDVFIKLFHEENLGKKYNYILDENSWAIWTIDIVIGVVVTAALWALAGPAGAIVVGALFGGIGGSIASVFIIGIWAGHDELGGIAGHAEDGTIEQCSNYGYFCAVDSYCGGIVGWAKNMTINNCFNRHDPGRLKADYDRPKIYDEDGEEIEQDRIYDWVDNPDALGTIVGYCEGCKITNNISTSNYNCLPTAKYIKDMDPSSGNNFFWNDGDEEHDFRRSIGPAPYEEWFWGNDFATGLIAYRLNNSKENLAAGIQPWRQNVGPGSYPCLDPALDEVTIDAMKEVYWSNRMPNVIRVSEPGDLKFFANLLNIDKQVNVMCVLENDIDLSGFELWEPIGMNDAPFRGLFDGAGHTIKGLKVNTNNAAGLFGYVGPLAIIENVTLEDSEIVSTGEDGAGGIVGTYVGNKVYGDLLIRNCFSSANVTAPKHAAGIFGRFIPTKIGDNYNDDIKIQIINCCNMGTITAAQGNSGLIGGYTRNSAVVKNCWSAGKLLSGTSTKPYDATHNEFFVGYMDKADIENCVAINPHVNVEGADENTKQTGVTNCGADCFASGELAYHLNGNTNDVSKSLTWQQELGEDAMPKLGNKGVYHTRTISNTIGTVCLPYALKSDEEVSYYRFQESKNEDGNIVLSFVSAENVLAGEPVLFRASKTGDLTFHGAGEGWEDMPGSNASPFFDWGIAGTYEQKVFDETTSPRSTYVYYISKGKVHNANEVTIAPYRAYLLGPSVSSLTSSGARISIMLDGEEDETTALELVYDYENDNENGNRSYTLFGTEAGEGYRGIVIRGGKKVIVNN